MSKQNVFTDFANLGDTGTDTAAAIQPILDGERGAATTFGRPDENLRSRTEILRQKVNELFYYRDFGTRHLIELSGGGSLTWEVDGAGRANNTTAMTLRPFLGPQTNVKGQLALGTAGSNQVLYTVQPAAYASDGMNAITVEHRHVLGTVTPVATVSAGPVYRILVVFDNTNTAHDAATVTPIVNAAIAGSTGLNGKLVATTNAIAAVAIFTTTGEIPINVRTHIAGTDGQASADVEAHTLAAGSLSSFTLANPLSEGDGVAIRYDYLVESTADTDDPKGVVAGGRAESNVARGNSNVFDNLFRMQDYPEWLPGSIPICRVINGKLFWCDGTVQETGTTVAPGETIVNSANLAYPGGPAWLDGTTNPATTIVLQIDKMITELAATAGAAKLGIAARVPWALGNGTPNNASSIYAAVNKIIQDLTNSDGSDLIASAAQTVGSKSVNLGTIYDQITDILGLIDAIQTDVDGHTLQEAYDASVASGPVPALTPIDIVDDRAFHITNSYHGQTLAMRFGAAVPALEVRAFRSALRMWDDGALYIGFRAPSDVNASYDYVLPGGGLPVADSFLQTDNAGVMTHRAVSDFALASQFESGAWTPAFVSSISGGVDAGDFTNLLGHYQRVGSCVFFTLQCNVNTTGWSLSPAASDVVFTLPVAGTVSGTLTGVGQGIFTTNIEHVTPYALGGATALTLSFVLTATNASNLIKASGSYILT